MSLLDKIKNILREAEEKKEKEEKIKKIILNQNKSKLIMHPPLKEQADKVISKVLSRAELDRAINFPEGVLADSNEKSSLKDYAFQVLQLRRGDI